GIGMGLLQRGLVEAGRASVTRPVFVADLADFDAAFICNSATPVCAVSEIDGRPLALAPDMIVRLSEIWRSQPCQAI
ncbi:MAG: aminotransferase class IV, partial [Brevundimonas sp.]